VSGLNLGIQLSTEQDYRIGDPQPHEEDDDAVKGTVGLVIGSEARDIEANTPPVSTTATALR
jgi:hypothetical protein